MLRFVFVIVVSMPFIIFYIGKGRYIERHDEDYSEEDRYKFAQRVLEVLRKNGRIETDGYGMEYLPKEGGYVMFSNHQGKYDAPGIMAVHEKPCTVVIDEKRSHLPIASPFITLIKGCRLDRSSIKSQVRSIQNIAKEVKEGRKYIIFPEGGYSHNHNEVQDFRAGAFQCAVRAKAPIVPVAIIDSYKPFEINSLRKVKTQVHFLEPLYYSDYAELSTFQIAEKVKQEIADRIALVETKRMEMRKGA